MATRKKKPTPTVRPAGSGQPPAEHTLCVNVETGRMARIATATLEQRAKQWRPATNAELAELDELNAAAAEVATPDEVPSTEQ